MNTMKGNLLEAAAIVERRGWCQHNFKDERGRVCIIAAIDDATTYRNNPGELKPAMDSVKVSLGIPGHSLAEWNDAPGRTKDEVLAALRAAAEVAS